MLYFNGFRLFFPLGVDYELDSGFDFQLKEHFLLESTTST